MSDNYKSALAQQFLQNAIELKEGDRLWLSYVGPEAVPFAEHYKKEAERLGATVLMRPNGSLLLNSLFASDDESALLEYAAQMLEDMKTCDAFLGVGNVGDKKHSKVTPDQQLRFYEVTNEATRYRVNNTRWVISSAPTEDFAALCGMGYEEFLKFYADACLFDHKRFNEPAERLKEIMNKASQVEIKGLDTHLTFSLEGIGAKECIGLRNMPDGEVYSAPVKGSVEGHVRFGPSRYLNNPFSGITLRYNAGRVVEAMGGNEEETALLNQILDKDEGARYPGEFAIAFHPLIEKPVGVILFDEKIRGSWHMASGAAYEGVTDNGNKSAVHWDMVQIQTPKAGGGEIWFDDRLIRKDGQFVVPELEGLNPEKLAPRP